MAKSIDQLWSELQQIQFDESNSLPCEFHIWKALLHKPICKGFFSDIIFK
nr:hypothetical protein [Acinetobacter ursingii]